jgi:hypothetical protein
MKTLKMLKSSTRYENKFQGGGTCQLTCRDCGKKYVGQTAETLKYVVKNICIKLGVIVENDHAFGKMDDIMEVMYVGGLISFASTAIFLFTLDI